MTTTTRCIPRRACSRHTTRRRREDVLTMTNERHMGGLRDMRMLGPGDHRDNLHTGVMKFGPMTSVLLLLFFSAFPTRKKTCWGHSLSVGFCRDDRRGRPLPLLLGFRFLRPAAEDLTIPPQLATLLITFGMLACFFFAKRTACRYSAALRVPLREWLLLFVAFGLGVLAAALAR